MARADQIPRQWRILKRLEAHRFGLSASDLADEEGCPVRTVYRDLADLEEAGFPLIQEKRDKRSFWRLAFQRNSPKIPFHYTEVCALWLGRRLMNFLEGTNFHDEISSAFEKIRSTLPPGVLEHLEEFGSKIEIGRNSTPIVSRFSEVLPTINEALEDYESINLVYFTPSTGEETKRRVDPYRLWIQEGAMYLIGFCHLREGVRTFNLARIRSITKTGEYFDEPDFDLSAYLDGGFRMMTGQVMQVEILFDSSVSHVAEEKHWHRTQEIVRQDDGTVLLRFKAGGLQEIKTWVLGFGPKIKVNEPAELREAVEQDLKAALARYA